MRGLGDIRSGSFLSGAFITAAMLIGLPLVGIFASGMDIRQFLEFPPVTRYVHHADFSWPAFILIGFMDILLFAFLFITLIHALRIGRQHDRQRTLAHFPWWGWVGLFAMLSGWILAWNRFDWFSSFQRHTFPILWGGYILTVNAWCFKRSSTCPMSMSPAGFSLLFFLSAVFWWFFEYLNRFVQNWYYIGAASFSSLEYVLFASVSFSTVLPAVWSTYSLLLTFGNLNLSLQNFPVITLPRSRWPAFAVLMISGLGLSFIGVWPDLLFPLLWVSPFLIVTALLSLFGQSHVFSFLTKGDWRVVVIGPLAALICGFFWEMWNINSLSKWEYAIPFVHRFKLFEMPILGYGGYLPFGLECLMVCQVVGCLRNLENIINSKSYKPPPSP